MVSLNIYDFVEISFNDEVSIFGLFVKSKLQPSHINPQILKRILANADTDTLSCLVKVTFFPFFVFFCFYEYTPDTWFSAEKKEKDLTFLLMSVF